MLMSTCSLPLSEPPGAAHVTGAAQPSSNHTEWAAQEKSQCPGAALLLNCKGDYPVVVWGFLN